MANRVAVPDPAPLSRRGAAPILRAASRSILRVVPPALWVVAALLVLPLLVAAATYRGMLEPLAIGVAGIGAIVFTLVNPRATLYLYVALIPLDAILVIGELGTLTRGVGAIFFAGYFLRRFGQVHLRTIPLAGWAFLAWSLASFTWAIDQSVASEQLVTLLQLFAMTVIIADFAAEEPDGVRPVLIAFTLAATATALFAIGAAAVGGGIGDTRIGAFDTQDVAQFSALLVPAFLFLLVELLEWRRPVPAVFGLMIVAAGIILSGTRSAWVATAVGAAIIVLPRIGRRALIPLVLLGLAGVALFTIEDLQTLVVDRISTALSSGGTGRIDIWSVGLNIFSSNPLIGVGYGNFPVAFTPEVIRDTNVPGLEITVLDPGAGSHSIIIGPLTELGVIGFALLAAFLWAAVMRRGVGSSWSVAQASLVALLSQALFLDVLNRKHVWLILALVLGLLWREARDRRLAAAGEWEEREDFARKVRSTWAPRT
jgi:O-antigen ligase